MSTNAFVTAPYGFDRGFEQFDYLGEGSCLQVNAKAIPWLQQHGKEKPFFLYLHTREPHLPYEPPAAFLPPKSSLKVFGNREVSALLDAAWATQCSRHPENPVVQQRVHEAEALYDGEIATNDAAFGDFVDSLKKAGLYDNSLIVLVSDHGEEFLDHGYLGHMSSLYQELLSVPLLVKFPRSEAANTTVEPCWQQIDIAPTILAYLGLPAPKTMVGLPYVPGGPPGDPNRPAFFAIKTGADGPRFGLQTPWLLDMDGVRTGRWVYNRTWACQTFFRLEPQQLFDLSADPHESRNLAYQHPPLSTLLNAYVAEKRLGHSVGESKASPEEVTRDLRSLQYVR